MSPVANSSIVVDANKEVLDAGDKGPVYWMAHAVRGGTSGWDLFCIVSLKYVSKVVSWRRIKAVAVGGGGQRRMRSEEDDDDSGNWDDNGM
ncbi:hypothetical protein Tco_0667794 [Tanacetum coccineum]